MAAKFVRLTTRTARLASLERLGLGWGLSGGFRQIPTADGPQTVSKATADSSEATFCATHLTKSVRKAVKSVEELTKSVMASVQSVTPLTQSVMESVNYVTDLIHWVTDLVKFVAPFSSFDRDGHAAALPTTLSVPDHHPSATDQPRDRERGFKTPARVPWWATSRHACVGVASMFQPLHHETTWQKFQSRGTA